MKGNRSALWSEYIIDGVRLNTTPGTMLETACERDCHRDELPSGQVVDESLDPAPASGSLSGERVSGYLSAIKAGERRIFPLSGSSAYTRSLVSRALLDSIWKDGHYRLGDIVLSASWQWNDGAVGNMAAFYASVEALCDSVDALGISLKDYHVGESAVPSLALEAQLSASADEGNVPSDDDVPFFGELPFRTEHPHMSDTRKCPGVARGDEGNWLIYIPFDTCQPLLGDSYLAQVAGLSCGKALEPEAPDYFIDCYEVVRELVEDGIAISGQTVSQGGLMSALDSLIPEGKAFGAEVGRIMKSYGGASLVNVLFAEVPGVVLEISGDDYDYVDAELLLQDVAYYPLGKFDGSDGGLGVLESDNSDISEILHSLLNVQISEGED